MAWVGPATGCYVFLTRSRNVGFLQREFTLESVGGFIIILGSSPNGAGTGGVVVMAFL